MWDLCGTCVGPISMRTSMAVPPRTHIYVLAVGRGGRRCVRSPPDLYIHKFLAPLPLVCTYSQRRAQKVGHLVPIVPAEAALKPILGGVEDLYGKNDV